MKARLAAYKDGKLETAYPLPEPGTTIGRDEESHIPLNHPLVSRHHAVVRAQDGMWVIKDLDSTNGLAVNGELVKYAVLKNGDALRIGPFEFVFEVVQDASEWGPAPGGEKSAEKRSPTVSERRETGGPETLPFK